MKHCLKPRVSQPRCLYLSMCAVDDLSLENNKPPVADAGPDKELTLPVDHTTLDGSKSSDDQKIVKYHWEKNESVP